MSEKGGIGYIFADPSYRGSLEFKLLSWFVVCGVHDDSDRGE